MYQAQFCKINGLDEIDIGDSIGLSSDSLEEAEGEVLEMGPPYGANFVKIIQDGRVVAKHGFTL